MKKTIAILLLVLSGSALAVTDADVYELQAQVKSLKMNQAINDRYVTALENRIAALEDRSQPRKSKAEFEAELEQMRKKMEAKEQKAKAQQQQ